MKDQVEEYEQLQAKIDNLFEAIKLPSWLTPKPRTNTINITHQKPQSVIDYEKSVENNTECPGGGNGRFVSELGSASGTFYSSNFKHKGFVKDLTPLINNAKISKKFLRCYDLTKDPMKIAWLFNGDFEADYLDWDTQQKKIIFSGKWKNPSLPMYGINVSNQTDSKSPHNRTYKVFLNKKIFGPFTFDQMIAMLQKKQLNAQSAILPSDGNNYIALSDDKSLSIILQNLAPKAKTTKGKTVTKTSTLGKVIKPVKI